MYVQHQRNRAFLRPLCTEEQRASTIYNMKYGHFMVLIIYNHKKEAHMVHTNY